MNWPRRDSKIPLLATGVAVLLGVAFIDYKTGPEYGFSVFYLLPILIFTWIGGKVAGISLTLIGLLLWIEVDILSGHDSGNLEALYWNVAAEFVLFIVSMTLLLKLKSAYQRERTLSRIDPLTGLANRRFFLELTQVELDWCRRRQTPLTIAYVDVDNFKTVNDTLGHQTGDRLLSEVANTLKENVRNIDIAARPGGDEFVVMFPELESSQARDVLKRLLSHLGERMSQHQWPVTFSIGAATYNNLDFSLEEMIAKVDALMYVAKEAGKNRLEYKIIG